jgi:hypothetical protein
MLNILCLKKEDIKTSKCGFNYVITVNDNFQLNLTKDALDELFNDINAIDSMGGYYEKIGEHEGQPVYQYKSARFNETVEYNEPKGTCDIQQ